MYKYIIFDVDGTLIDTHEATIMALDKVLKEVTGHSFKREELLFAIGVSGKVSLPRFGITSRADIESVSLKWSEYLRLYSMHIKMYPGIEKLFAELNENGAKMGLVTSNTRYELNALMQYFLPFNPRDYVEHIVCSDDTIRNKPHPDPILKFLELSGCQPSEAIYIGDTAHDFNCAQSAGVDFGLAAWGAGDIRNISPRYIFKAPGSVIDTVCTAGFLDENCI
jgi:HAD superfamily hydrolase (TIGR01549 family)